MMYKILIVDDERNERTGIEKLIKRYHYDLDVKQAANGMEALDILRKEHIDIVLTDIKMPFMTGVELIGEIHKIGQDPICIIYSAYSEFEYAQNAIALGVLQYLLKPIKLNEFQNLFDKVLLICEEKKKQREENERLKRKLKEAENEKIYRQLLWYLESESDVLSKDENFLFTDGPLIPIIISSYSYLFSKYWENYAKEITDIFLEQVIIINKDDTQTLLLVRYSTSLASCKMKLICERLIKMSREKYQSELFIVVGRECGSINELKKVYEKMREQLDYQFFISESMYFVDEGNNFVKKEGDMLSLYFKKISTYARLKDYKGMRQEFEKAFLYVENTIGFSSVYTKYNFSEIIKDCCEILNKEKHLVKVVEAVYGSQSFQEVKNAVYLLLEEFERTQGRCREENKVVTLAKKYIHNHYQDYTLSVSAIADELNISTAYLSTVFKVETNQNLIKYITEYRIEKAKELLMSTNMKVSDVAEKVGYLNSSYFISLFRNNTGYSPSKYRERTMRDV